MQEFNQFQKVLKLSDREIAAFAKSENSDVKVKLLLTKSLPDKNHPVQLPFWHHTISFIDAVTEITDVQYVCDLLQIPEQLVLSIDESGSSLLT